MRKPFTDEEKKFIIENYTKFSNKELADRFNRTKEVIDAFGSYHSLRKEDKIKVGEIFGKLEVKELLPEKRQRSKLWLCLCKCGNYSKVCTTDLRNGHSQSCGCGRIEAISSNVGYVSGTWYGAIQKNARTREIDFLVTQEYLNDLLIKQDFKCAISQLPIEIKMGRQNTETTASLDRIDNTLPYIEGNVQFLHKHVNYMKWTHTQEYFIELCKLIAQMN